jgi:cytoskeletal protein CcmA (bactofilin family)
VTVEKGAKVQGNVSGENVWVAGKVIGNIEARKHLHLASSSYITGDTSYQTLRIEEGAFFTGKMELADEHAAAEKTPGSEPPATGVPDAAPVQSQYKIAPPQAEPVYPIRSKRVVIS